MDSQSIARPGDSLVYRLVFSKVNYWFGFGLDIALGLVLLAFGLASRGFAISTLVAAAAGWLVFTFIEYSMHRWGYHGPDSMLSYPHKFHHSDGTTMVGVPFFYPIGIAAILIGLAQLVAPLSLVAVFGGTILLVYEAQTFVHAIAHKWPGARGIKPRGLIKRLCRHHAIHHAGDGTTNYGMSTTLWDRVFGTYASRVTRRREVQVRPVFAVVAPTRGVVGDGGQ